MIESGLAFLWKQFQEEFFLSVHKLDIPTYKVTDRIHMWQDTCYALFDDVIETVEEFIVNLLRFLTEIELMCAL